MNLKNSSSSDYLTYKKSRMNPARVQRVEKRIEKIKRIFKLSVVTFCIMFAVVVVFIKKYAKRVDIEYGRHGAEIAKENQSGGATQGFSVSQGFGDGYYDNDKRTIDKRLLLIQEEENAPSESRVLPQDRDKNEVMNLEHYEKLKSNREAEDAKAEEAPVPKKAEETKPQVHQASPQESGQGGVHSAEKPINIEQQGVYSPIELPKPANIKVLVGRYSTFEEAKNAQTAMKNSKAKIAPFIRKVDNVYSLQIGSYTNMDVARGVAGSFSMDGFDAWIYQQ